MAGQPYKQIRSALPDEWSKIDHVLKQLDITPRKILAGILNIAEHGKSERDRLRAWDVLGRLANMRPPVRIEHTGLEGVKLRFEGGEDA